MITSSPDAFLEAFAALPASSAATARAAFLVAPSTLTLAAESARDNRYMNLDDTPDAARALAQHNALAEALRADLPVITFPGCADTPDAVFPNNIFATAADTLIVGRMRHAVRQREANRNDIREFFGKVLGYDEIDLSGCTDLTAELTGMLIIDRARGVGFCGLGERCDEAGARAMHDAFGLELTLCFELAAGEYHSNVVMALLASRGVILAADGFADAAVPKAIARAYGDCALWLDQTQKREFTGNAISLAEDRVWMSARGAAALTAAQRGQLQDWGFAIGTVDLSEIEKSGGSLRCCVAEIF